jgi:hypothetical protein
VREYDFPVKVQQKAICCNESCLTFGGRCDIFLMMRKHLTPETLGALLYETLREAVASTEELAVGKLLSRLEIEEETLPRQYVGEIMAGCLYAATLAVERSASEWIGQRIVAGMKEEFVSHLREQGATPQQVQQWKGVVDRHFVEYGLSMEDYEGLEPPWKLGRQLLQNFSGRDDHPALSVKHATEYLVTMQTLAQQVLNDYGPRLDTSLQSHDEGE